MRTIQTSLLNFIVLGAALSASCQSHSNLSGTIWRIEEGSIPLNFNDRWHYQSDVIRFGTDSVELSSGFFYNILDREADSPAIGRFPFVYYGKKERYFQKGDSVFIHSKPYREWNKFKIIRGSEYDKIVLCSAQDSLMLKKWKYTPKHSVCSIEYVVAHVYELGLGLYDVDYFVTYSDDDSLVYKRGGEDTSRSFRLRHGTFREICEGLSAFDVKQLKEKYHSYISEKVVVKLEIGFKDGSIYKTELQNREYPEGLHLALIPVLYGHQVLVDGHIKPVK